jgi:hypothetical protein
MPFVIDRQGPDVGGIDAQQDRALSATLQGLPSSTQGPSLLSHADMSGLLHCGLSGVLDPHTPVDSIDQLYFQAIALSPFLTSKVQGWAAVSEGFFSSAAKDVVEEKTEICQAEYATSGSNADGIYDLEAGLSRCPAGFVRWLDVVKKERQVGGQVRWAKVKSVQRSIEKMTRSYGKVCWCWH